MNVLLWLIQALLALHTAMRAVWKLSHSEQAVPSLQALPHGVWLGLSAIEMLCAAALVKAAGSPGGAAPAGQATAVTRR